MELYYTGVIIAVSTFLIIGLFHPIVIKVEYHTGTRYWWVFLVSGIISVGAAFLVADVLYSALLGVLGASCLWSIGELFEQKERCEKDGSLRTRSWKRKDTIRVNSLELIAYSLQLRVNAIIRRGYHLENEN